MEKIIAEKSLLLSNNDIEKSIQWIKENENKNDFYEPVSISNKMDPEEAK